MTWQARRSTSLRRQQATCTDTCSSSTGGGLDDDGSMTDSDSSGSSDRAGSAETVQNAWEALLTAVQNGADDLRLFHDTMRRAQLSPTAPFPRAMVATTERIIRNLGHVDQELRDVLAELGLTAPERP